MTGTNRPRGEGLRDGCAISATAAVLSAVNCIERVKLLTTSLMQTSDNGMPTVMVAQAAIVVALSKPFTTSTL